MRRRDAVVGLVAAGFVILALLAVFAIELSNTQAKSKRDVTARVHERAVLAAALIDSLFQSSQQQIPQDARIYGTRVVTTRTMNNNARGGAYLALLDSRSRVLASSHGFTPQARADLRSSAALRLIATGHRYGLGNLLPYGNTGVINLAVPFLTPYGQRTLLSGFTPSLLATFITGELRRIPGVKGAHNYLLEGNNVVLASTNASIPPGHVFNTPAQLKALARSSGDRNGHYYDQVPLTNSTWRILLTAPNGALFASVTGLRKWVPWMIFAAFAVFAAAALLLGRRAVRSAEEVHAANARLELVNRELADSNDALARRAQELARSNEELEGFASIASHDLQEPLRKVRTFTQQLNVVEADRLSDRGRDYLNRANAAAERMQNLIEDLLKFSRVATHARPFAPVDLKRITGEVLEDLSAQVEQSGAVVHVGELPTISADQLQIRQLLQNLISNALKFRRENVTPEVTIDATVADDKIELSVSDNGIGFDPQYSRRIFRVFERLHGRGEYPGTGIGLALCRKIAERHGGSVVADGEPGVGSTFIVTLPVHQADEVIAAFTGIGNGATPEREEDHVPA
jgi:signal transduction histidine kinase